MTVHDSKALLPAIKDTKARGVMPKHIVADTHYGSTKCIAQAKAKGITLLAPAMPPKGKGQGKLTLEDFDLDTSGHIQRCPAGHAPRKTSVSKKRLQVRFAQQVCDQCLSADTQADRSAVRCTAQAGLKHQMGLAHLQVRGQGAVQYRVWLRALGLNIHPACAPRAGKRVAVYRGSFYPQKLFGRLLSALRGHQRVPKPYKLISGSTNRRFEALTTRVYRWLSPLFSKLFADPSTFDNISVPPMACIKSSITNTGLKPKTYTLHQNDTVAELVEEYGLKKWLFIV